MLQGIPWRYSCGNPVTSSSDAPQSATAWWRLVPSLLASGLHHSINKNVSLMTACCCEARFGNAWDTDTQWYPERAPKNAPPVVQWALLFVFHLFGSIPVREGTRGISLKGTTPPGRFMVWTLSARRAGLFSGNPVSCLSPWRDGTGCNRVRRSSSLHALSPDDSLKAVSNLRGRDRQCVNTLRGSDTTHPAACSS